MIALFQESANCLKNCLTGISIIFFSNFINIPKEQLKGVIMITTRMRNHMPKGETVCVIDILKITLLC